MAALCAWTRLHLAPATHSAEVSSRCCLPSIWYRLYRDAPSTASTTRTSRFPSACSAHLQTLRSGHPAKGVCEEDGLSQRAGFVSDTIGGFAVHPHAGSEKAMRGPKVTAKGVSNSCEIAFRSLSKRVDATRSPPHQILVGSAAQRTRGPSGHRPAQITSIRWIPRCPHGRAALAPRAGLASRGSVRGRRPCPPARARRRRQRRLHRLLARHP